MVLFGRIVARYRFLAAEPGCIRLGQWRVCSERVAGVLGAHIAARWFPIPLGFRIVGRNNGKCRILPMKKSMKKGYTLIELIVALGLFAMVMTLVANAYIMIIGVTRQAQHAAIGVDNLTFALETMMRTIRTGSAYTCMGVGNCSGGTSFSLRGSGGEQILYTLANGTIQQTKNGVTAPLTDASIVQVSSLKFYVSGTQPESAGDTVQPYVTMTVSGKVQSGSSQTESFSLETGAVMRGVDL